jgi:quaternary ammonium compound-resistance protein SugE
MNWVILIIAGFCECSFTFCLGKAKETAGTAHWLWIAGFIFFTIASMYLLFRASRTLPLSVAYPVWTGIGAVGTVLLGIFVLHEPTSAMQLFFTFTLVASVVGLKIVS